MDNNFVFQVDAPIVKDAYKNLDNYLIEYDNTASDKNTCAIYFSGHSIYYPNDEDTFNRMIVKRNRFEWYGIRFPNTYKHIFIRDIHKQWYLTGVNTHIDTPEKLYKFLEQETKGCRVKVIGSSAGGYASILYGNLLNAETVLAFSPRTEMFSLEQRSTPKINPLFFKYKDTDLAKYMDIANYDYPLIEGRNTQLFCFYPTHSNLDKIQLKHLESSEIIKAPYFHLIYFNTKKHGVPFPKVALSKLMNESNESLLSLKNRKYNPIIFSIKKVGFYKTVVGVVKQVYKHLKK